MNDKQKYQLMVDYKYAAIRKDVVEMKQIEDELKHYNVDVTDAVWIRENVQVQHFWDNDLNKEHVMILQ